MIFKIVSWFLVTFIFINPCFAQNILTKLSQKTNYFLSVDSYGLTWISSLDGVNVFNGRDVKIYKSDKYNLIGNNIQSKFFEDCNSNIWFSTYNALHIYDRKLDNFRPFQFKNLGGEIIVTDYKVLGYIDGFVIFRMEEMLAILDINTEQISQFWSLGLSKFIEFEMHLQDKKLVILASNLEETVQIKSNHFLTEKPQIFKIFNNYNIEYMQFLDQNNVLIKKFQDNLILICDLEKKAVKTFYEHTKEIKGVFYRSNEGRLFFVDDENFHCASNYLGTWTSDWVQNIPLKGKISRLSLFKNISWFGVEGKGLVFVDVNKKNKFKHHKLESNGRPANARSFKQDLENNFWFCSRDNGIGKFDKNGNLLKQYNKHNKNSPTDLILAIETLDNDDIIGVGGNHFVKYNRQRDIFKKFIPKGQNSNQYFGGILKLENGELLVWDYFNLKGIYKLRDDKQGNFELKKLDIESNIQPISIFNVIKVNNKDKLYLDINATHVGIGELSDNKLVIDTTWFVNSGLTSVSTFQNKNYVSTTDGLYLFEENTNNHPKKVIDKNGYLNQCVYHILDHKDLFFLSTNEGIVQYDPQNDISHRFSLADGLQGLEFNKTAALKDKDGFFLFGGTNGVNRFHPDSIKLSSHQATVFVSEIMVNDQLDTENPNHDLVANMTLNYRQNTISFRFSGIDYSDPAAVRLEYQLLNYDKVFLKSRENEGFTRYANLPPGQYKFQAIAINSDGIRSNLSKVIEIKILPPFWKTWWFMNSVLLSVFGFGFYVIKSYYKNKIENQKRLLREQALIIEKQEAVEKERTRIASEMHDDLGAGLTTIRYLSDKAFAKAVDEDEKNQIGKIAEHSNTLVRNMSEIIWALNSRFDTSSNLVGYLRRYASEYLEDRNLDHSFTLKSVEEEISISGEKRRNIFLVMKEILHNTIKYSYAEKVDIHLEINEKFVMTIFEKGGCGFDATTAVDKGNGIYNIQKRMQVIGGDIFYNKTEEGMNIIILCPIN